MKKNISHILICLVMMTTVASFSQMITIEGIITDTDSNQIDGATIVLYSPYNKMMSYTISDQSGYYTLETEFISNYTIEVSHVAFDKKTKKISSALFNGQTVKMDFVLHENIASLDEVIVLSANKENDTVPLDLKKLKLFDDSSLKDILKKVPNFRLGDDGTIIYKGKSIDKILVNKKESFINQNSIALESIENKIIKGINIINNYTDSFSLDFDEIEETVLNIDTKSTTKNIMNGSFSLKYGVKKKYQLNGTGLLFSKNLNAFLTSNINNIGKKIIKHDEINALFNKNQAFSPYQISSLANLFVSDENLKKDFFSNTNLTIRNQKNRIKTSGLLYYITPDRIQSLTNTISTLDQASTLNQQSIEKLKANALIGAASIAYKLTDKTILSYHLNGNWIDYKATSNMNHEFFESGVLSNQNTINSNNFRNTHSIINQISVATKLNKRLISNTTIGLYNESSDLYDNYILENETNTQDYNYQKNNYRFNSYFKYNLSKEFIPQLSFEYNLSEEKIKDQFLSTPIIKRDIPSRLIHLDITGQDVFKKINYELKISLDHSDNTTSFTKKNSSSIIPIDLSVDYENKLKRIDLTFTRKRLFNDLASGIETIQAFNKVISADTNLPGLYSVTNKLKGGYSHNDIFNGTSYSFILKYNTHTNTLKNNFLNISQGITSFGTYIADTSEEFKIEANYSKTIIQIKFPTKIDFGLYYKTDSYPSIVNSLPVEIQNTYVVPSIQFETITDNLINIRLSSKISFIDYEIGDVNYKGAYRNNSMAILLKNKHWKADLSLLYDHNTINNTSYFRKNINTSLSYTKNKFTFSMEARHIGELLSLIDNDAYNSQFNIINGISNLTINNQSLNYLLFGITYKL